MIDPDADPREYDPNHYWEDPGGFQAKGLTPEYWNDPWPELQGMLTSDRIRAYHEAIGRMIRPFDPDLLKTASYELTLGAYCIVEGEDRVLTEADKTLEIPPNSIAFVSMRQVLCLPHYIVGRFDLQIRFIYKGLLLGTGPQVDPGFQGALSCPLHNISNDAIYIDLDDPFAKLDFAKTVPRSDEIQGAWQDIRTEEELAEWLRRLPRDSWARLFKRGEPNWRRPITGYIENGRRPRSSVAELRDQVDDVERETSSQLSTFRRLGYGAILLGVLTVLFAIPAFVFDEVNSKTDPLATKEALTKAGGNSALAFQQQANEIRSLRNQVRQLRRQLGPP